MTLEVAETLQSDKAQPIGEGYLVLTAADQSGFADVFSKFKVGDQVTLNTVCSDSVLSAARWATGAGDILVKDGAVTDAAAWDKSIANKNPRTAFGVKADGTVISYVVDGRESDNSAGLTLKDLAEEMLRKGCVSAVNFDGGGSSAMSVRLPGLPVSGVVNTPSDGSARKCGAYLLFVTDKKPDGAVRYLHMKEDGIVVLAGSSFTMSYGGTDGGFMPVPAPADVVAVSGGLGVVIGTTYTAGPGSGADKLTLSSASTNAAGSATIHIISDPTDIKVTADGGAEPVTALTVWPGDSVQLAATASYYGFPVVADAAAFKYSVTDISALVSEDGLLWTGPAAGVAGAVNVTVGGTTKVIPVTVTGFSDLVNHWAKQYVRGLYEKGIVAGMSPTVFGPDAHISRGDFTLMLYRAAGRPAVEGASTFTVVLPEDY
jgi:hypothetical protein